jgi:hypothetical protein
MFFDEVHEELDSVQDEAKPLLQDYFGGQAPRFFDSKNLTTFFGELTDTFFLIVREPEILLFAALQWLVIAVAYIAWPQMLYWIPDDLWNAAQQNSDRNFFFINMTLLAWSVLVVAAASYPIAILNAAVIAARNLRTLDQSPGVLPCLNIATRHAGRLWAFTCVDAWITVSEIIDRLPKKHYHHTMVDEFAYYAWKIGTIGVVPALVAGKTFSRAAWDSTTVLRAQTAKAVGLRMGYSLVCWVVGIVAYAGTLAYVAAFDTSDQAHLIYNRYSLVTIPLIIAVGVVAVIVRPLYLIMTAKLYTDVMGKDIVADEATPEPPVPHQNVFLVIFLVLAFGLSMVCIFPDMLGIRHAIAELAAKDLH